VPACPCVDDICRKDLAMPAADFKSLPIDTGVGDYHFNRFRVAFKKPNVSAATLAEDFSRNFPTYLNSPFAKVVWGDHTFESKPTLRFHGIVKGRSPPHSDWVVRQWYDPTVGFTAQTLKREFGDLVEDGVGGTAGFVVAGIVGSVIGVHDNRLHFLAGRRSWRVGEGPIFGIANGLFVLETIAVERFSARCYQVAGDALEDQIPNIWAANLNNFIKMKGLTRVPQPSRKLWKQRMDVDFYQQKNLKDLSALKADPEFIDAYPLFRTILP
jgi:hypothetical protein